MNILCVQLLLLVVASRIRATTNGTHSRDSRATRMSVVDFWKNETHGDGLNVRVAHGVNSWPALVEQLQEPFLNKSLMLEGDVFLQTHRRPRHRAIPVMSAPPSKQADRITFKEWLREVAGLRKAIKINFRSTEVVHPVLEYLHAAQFDPSSPDLDYPLILHADVFQAPGSTDEPPVDADVFIRATESLFPDATLSLGWHPPANYSSVDKKHKKLTWRALFSVLDYIALLEQPVMLSLRLSVAANSKEQLLWLLGMNRTLSLLIWSDENDEVHDWQPLLDLRRSSTKNRVVYDLLEKHRKQLQAIADDSDEPITLPCNFDVASWQPFVPSAPFSTVMPAVLISSRGPAFRGRSADVLLLSTAAPSSSAQTVSGTIRFLPKHGSGRSAAGKQQPGVVVLLLEGAMHNQTGRLDQAIEILIGVEGRVSIERHRRGSSLRARNSSAAEDNISIGQGARSHCYAFTVNDVGWKVTAEITPTDCSDATEDSSPSSCSLWSRLFKRKHSTDRKDLSPVFLRLETPNHKNRRSRSIAVSKRGDESVDVLFERLLHSSASLSALSLFSTISLLMLFRLFFSSAVSVHF